MEPGFIKAPKILREDHRSEDLLGLDSSAKQLAERLESLKESGLFALVGPFGSGKSTLLEKVKNGPLKESNWLEFDAWKFPERKELWEGFVLEVARQIDLATFEKIRNKVDGKAGSAKEKLLTIIAEGTNLMFPGATVIKNLSHFINTSPARRVFEIQEILKNEIFDKNNKNIFVIVEDIDRSGDAGIFFLETLKHFLKNAGLKNQITAIVPIANENFYNHQDAYLKCLDVVEFFPHPIPKLDNFVAAVFNEDLLALPNQKAQMIGFLESLFEESSDTTLRLIKLILRKANLNFIGQSNDGHAPDWRTSILFETAKYFRNYESNGIVAPSSTPPPYFFDTIKTSRSLGHENIFSAFACAIAENRPSLYRGAGSERELAIPKRKFKLVSRGLGAIKQPSAPYFVDSVFEDECGWWCSDFYLGY